MDVLVYCDCAHACGTLTSGCCLVEVLYFLTKITQQRQLSNNNTPSVSSFSAFIFSSQLIIRTFRHGKFKGICIMLPNPSPGSKILKNSLVLYFQHITIIVCSSQNSSLEFRPEEPKES